MNRSQADNWSVARSCAFLAAIFAVVFGSLMPFAALAASSPGRPMVICSAEGPQTIAIGVDGEHGEKSATGVKCAACLLAFAVALPEPPLMRAAGLTTTRPASEPVVGVAAPPPPARAPPRPPSTAPPLA